MRIAIAHDFLRSKSLYLGLGNADDHGRFIAALIAPALQQLGHDVHRVSEVRGDRADALTSLLDQRGWPRDVATWARAFSDPARLPDILPLLMPLAAFDLVIGWEMTPNMLRFLAQRRIRFIDIGIDPIRFAPDLFVRMRTNEPRIADRLAVQETPDAPLAAEAARLRASLPPPERPRGRAVVFAGQMEIDASLVVDAEQVRVDPFIPAILASLAPGQSLLLKPHPHGAPHTDVQALHRAAPDARVVDDNIYGLLAAPWVERVVTLSSSVADEAAQFGKPATRLIAPDHISERVGGGISRHFRIDARYPSMRFWSDLLTRARGAAVPDEPPARPIRSMYSHTWGFGPWPPPAPDRRVAPGEELHFGNGLRGHALCVIGWGAPEEWGVWSDSDLATILFEPAQSPAGMTLELHLTAFVPRRDLPMVFDLSIRPGGIHQTMTLTSNDVAPIVFDVSAADCRGDGPIEVAFRFHALRTPASVGASDDHRRLGVGLRKLVARPR